MPIHKSILGISPGTRRIGLVILKRGRLVHWEIKTFYAPWSNSKASHIAHTITRYVERYDVDCIALKIHHKARSSNGLEYVIHDITALADERMITLQPYSIEELNTQCSFNATPCKNKSVLAASILHKYPDLIGEYRKVCSKGKLHYMKIFEAAACAHCTLSRS